jgi:hypothetical protein
VTEDREARIGQNEALFREVNERIEGLTRGIASVSDEMMHIVCECGEGECVEQLAVSVSVYERVRSDPTHFLVKPGHEKPSTEVLIEEGDGYNVVRKDGPVAERIAEETDPRS